MPSLVEVHLIAQARLRALLVAAVGAAWADLPGYDDADVPGWLATVLPMVDAAQRRSVALTDAYVARALDRPLVGLDMAALVGSSVRAGTPMQDVYRRPFVQTWSALARGALYEDAVEQGMHRAEGMARMDVQRSHFSAYDAIRARDPAVRGFQRVADAAACDFCKLVNGAFVKSANASPLHNGCGCGLKPLLYDVDPSPVPDGVAVHEHGEMGLLIGDPSHGFTSEADFR